MVYDRCYLIFQFISQKFANEEDLSVFFQREKTYLIQEKLTTTARLDHENAFALKKLLKTLEPQNANDNKKSDGRDSTSPITSKISSNYMDLSVDSERFELI